MVILEIIGFIILAVILSVVPFAVHLLALAIIDDSVNDEPKQDELKRGALYFNIKADAPSIEQIRQLCTVKRNGKNVLMCVWYVQCLALRGFREKTRRVLSD